ncbi:3'-5' exonuclease [Thaumasiovibrio subtropicus]|uniref:3'-5' exonuclease n=1 Tax=Thaumasiovibrio subtropicus TaxID=1891207 RepID=UPI000B352FB3|nr:3'-5' exonuclease [Thaumasiovibrio subtropicus]
MKPLTKTALDWQNIYQNQAQKSKDLALQRFYRQGVQAASTPLSEVEFVALDLETTGLNAKKDDIISIGLVPFTLQRIYCREAQHWIVNPRKPLSEESVVIHGITHSEIDEAPDLRRLLTPLLDHLTGKIIVVHYQHIERSFLDEALKVRLGEGIKFPVVDTMAIESAVQRQQHGGWINRLMGKKPGSVRLGSSRERYGLPVYQPHHALSDAIATAELLQAQIAHHYTPETPLSALWV